MKMILLINYFLYNLLTQKLNYIKNNLKTYKMSRIDKKSFNDITVFLPESFNDEVVEYELNIDYNSEILSSPFTRELSGIYIDFILENLGDEEGKVFAWGIRNTPHSTFSRTII